MALGEPKQQAVYQTGYRTWSLQNSQCLDDPAGHHQPPTDRPPCLQPITGAEFKTLFGPASMHALGHIAANLSFAAVAISLTHTVKTLEPAFSVVLSKLILGQSTPLPVVATLAPIMVRTGHRHAALVCCV